MSKADRTRKREARLIANTAAELNKKHPEPMSLFHKREKMGEIPKGDFFIYRKPEIPAGVAERAADAMAAWDNSDPFARGRTLLHVKQGYLIPSEVEKEMSLRTIARKAAKVREVEAMKRRTDAE